MHVMHYVTRPYFVRACCLLAALEVAFALFWPVGLWSLIGVAPYMILGIYDYNQKSHAIRRTHPFFARLRFLMEEIRPEIRQYFIESDTDGRPFPRIARNVIYQRAKRATDTVPFGTLLDVNEVGYEFIAHSMAPVHFEADDLRVKVGGPDCKKPYLASVFNISAMSYGSLSKAAIMALNGGAKLGGFMHNTGEGGLTPHHLKMGGDICWQIGTGYFGCRTDDGKFDPDKFADKASHDAIKMIEIKISQGAKPGHGGILPAAKVTAEIAEIRGVPMGADCLSPPAHTAFSTPIELCKFIQELRELSDGKPIGFKLCIGKRREFLAVCKAMVETGIKPDFITVDGGEGGTGAAPLEFTNRVGAPGIEGLVFVHNALVGFDLRKDIRIISAAKVHTGFDIISRIALGADLCNAARAFMMSIGCIQALTCNSNTCPVGVATQNPHLVAGLVVEDKKVRCFNFHRATIASCGELLGAMGLTSTHELRPWHLFRRTAPNVIKHYGEIYEYIAPGSLLKTPLPESFARATKAARSASFDSHAPGGPEYDPLHHRVLDTNF